MALRFASCLQLDQESYAEVLRWRSGKNSYTGTCFDIGNTTCKALIRFELQASPLRAAPIRKALAR